MPKRVRQSPQGKKWARLIEGCPRMVEHFNTVIARDDVYLDEVGIPTAITCLSETFQLSEEQAESFEEHFRFDLDNPSYRALVQKHERFRGHLRMYPDDPASTEWVSTEGLEEVCERLQTRFDRDHSWKTDGIFAFAIDFGDSSYDDGQATSGPGAMKVGDVGWLVDGVYTEDERHREVAIASWTPFDDAQARRTTIIRTYARDWATYEWAPFYYSDGLSCWGDTTLLLDCLIATIRKETASQQMGLIKALIYRKERLAALDGIDASVWRDLGTPPPDASAWDALTAELLEARREDEDFLRPFVAAYVAELVRGRHS